MLLLLAAAASSAHACEGCPHHHPAPHGPADRLADTASGPAAPASGAALRFVVVGDTQGLQHLEQLTTDMNAHNPEFAIFPGDLVSTGSPSSWARWKELSDHFVGGPTNRFMVPGNHDLSPGRPGSMEQWREAFPWLPADNSPDGFEGIDYYFDRGGSRFISLTNNTETQYGGSPTNLNWLAELLQQPDTRDKDHVFVMSHHPVTFDVWETNAPTGGTASEWWKTLADANVTTLFAGHWHQYQPGQPDPHHATWEVIAGTGNSGFSGYPWQNRVGYSIVDVAGPEVTLRFYGDRDGDGAFDDLLDTARLATAQPPAPGIVSSYEFGSPTVNYDTAISPHAKANHGVYHGDARVATDPARGSILLLDGDGDYAEGRGIGDYNLAILRDLTIAVSARLDQLDGDATLVSYTGDVAGYTDRDEIVNQPYNLSVQSDGRLRLFWERNNGQRVEFLSTAAARPPLGVWREFRVTRDAEAGEVRFYVDRVQLGETLTFDPASQLPTGGQQGLLRIGVNYDRDTPGKLTAYVDGAIGQVAIFNDVTLEPYQGPTAGDLNRDGVVDQLDVEAFVAGWRTVRPEDSLETRWAKGDMNLDGVGDLEDVTRFQAVLTEKGIAAPVKLPEATTAGLFAAGAALVGHRRPGKTRR